MGNLGVTIYFINHGEMKAIKLDVDLGFTAYNRRMIKTFKNE